MLSLAAAVFYCVVAGGCMIAAGTAAKLGQPKAHRNVWLTLAAFFLVLFLMRGFGIEEWLRETMREVLRSDGSYAERRGIQGIFASIVLAGIAAGGFWWLYHRTRGLRGRRNVAVMGALASAGAMFLLVLLRLISLHAIDGLLYGPLKLNWIGDIGTSLIVLGAAGYYVKLVRDRP